jgi:hypothetical protein
MDKPTQTTLNPDITSAPTPKNWWQKGIFSEKGLIGKWLHRWFGHLFRTKEEISESTIFLYNRAMSDIRILGKNMQIIDNEKFGNDEFLVFIKIKYLLNKNLDESAGLLQSIQLLQLAIDTKDSFIAIDQTELRYRGSKQQDFYQYVEDLLANHSSTESFRQNVQLKLAETIPQTKTEEGKIALNSYSKHLDRLSENELGLKLLSLFKAYQLADYSVLREISELVQSLNKRDLQDYQALVSLVMTNYSSFEKLRKIISVSDKNNNPETYARMIQYIGLSYRHSLSYIKFEELMGITKRWFRPYQTADGATSTLESRQGKLHSSSSSNVILQSMAANLH